MTTFDWIFVALFYIGIGTVMLGRSVRHWEDMMGFKPLNGMRRVLVVGFFVSYTAFWFPLIIYSIVRNHARG